MILALLLLRILQVKVGLAIIYLHYIPKTSLFLLSRIEEISEFVKGSRFERKPVDNFNHAAIIHACIGETVGLSIYIERIM
jgi:hypothetical protein